MAVQSSAAFSIVYPEARYTARIDEVTLKQNDKWGTQYSIVCTIIGPEEVPTGNGALNPIGVHFRMSAFPEVTDDWAGPRWIGFLRAIQPPEAEGVLWHDAEGNLLYDDEHIRGHLQGLTFDIVTGSVKEYFDKDGGKYGVTDVKKAAVGADGQALFKSYKLAPSLEQVVGKGSRPRPTYIPALNKGHDHD